MTVRWSAIGLLMTVVCLGQVHLSSVGSGVAESTRLRVAANYAKLPLVFEPNRGQADARARFLSRGPGYNLFLTSNEAVFLLSKPAAQPKPRHRLSEPQKASYDYNKPLSATALRMKLVGANPTPEVLGVDELPGKSNYFIGDDPSRWHTNITNYGRIRYHNVYPGIDLIYYGNQRELEYDFVVAPGGDPQALRLDVDGAKKVMIDAKGDLVLHTDQGDIRLQKPVVYQDMGGVKQTIAAHYALRGKHGVGFEVGPYDTARLLVIDPVLTYSTFLSGSGNDLAIGITVDGIGNAYVTGETSSSNFPTTVGAFQTSNKSTSPTSTFGNYGYDAFVTKLNPTGTTLLYSTYLGGNLDDSGAGIAVDSLGNAYVTGRTSSTNFPTTLGAFQTLYPGSPFGTNTYHPFITKLNALGNGLLYSTYLGGSDLDAGLGITVDSAGDAFVTGFTKSLNFPTTVGAYQPTWGGGVQFVATETFVTKLNPLGTALLYSTYLGTNSGGYAIAIDGIGDAYITGITNSGFPVTAGASQTTYGGGSDSFVTKLNPTGSGLVYSTYMGGSGFDFGSGIALDSAGSA